MNGGAAAPVERTTGDGAKDARTIVAITAAALLVRLLALLGRGDYVAFDEGWYLLLGRNLWAGDGYTLSGLVHVALSPLFPILAGALDLLIGDAVWAGRLVAAVASGLLVVPCWYIFQRIGGRAVAITGALFVATMPSLAPFGAPFWIGWDLWVGAEPLLHLLLFTGIALLLRAVQDGGGWAAAGSGVAFALAYLARPEAIVAFGFYGVAALALAGVRTARRVRTAVLASVAFVVLAAPYWLYLRTELGRWTITGRAVDVVPSFVTGAGGSGRDGTAPPNRVEVMLWQDDQAPYVRRLYALDASGAALANGYWGVRPPGAQSDRAPAPAPEPGAGGPGGEGRPPGPELAAAAETAAGAAAGDPSPVGPTGAEPATPVPTAAPQSGMLERPPPESTSWFAIYARAIGIVVPLILWPFIVLGLVVRDAGRVARLEILFVAPLVACSLAIAVMVAVDPRTQLFVAPLAAFYAARGAVLAARALRERLGPEVRPRFASVLVVGALTVVLLGTNARRLWLSLTLGSPHHIVGAENAQVGAVLREATPPDATVMSWHPAIALYADRDWRVLPYEPVERIVTYARRQPQPYLVLSIFYPPRLLAAEEPHYLIVPVPPDAAPAERWRIEIARPAVTYAFGTLIPEG